MLGKKPQTANQEYLFFNQELFSSFSFFIDQIILFSQILST